VAGNGFKLAQARLRVSQLRKSYKLKGAKAAEVEG
jgi:hypothetical protein